jgi:glycosyltransferase involved in cell wall biosynthesis
VVDDGSTDGTPETLRRRWPTSVKVVEHERNRGIQAARATGVVHAQADWVVVLDSDWELRPGAVERLAAIVNGLPPDVNVVRTRILWDDGSVTPHFIPEGPVDYRKRIEFVHQEGGHDAGRCIKRAVFDQVRYISDRRGAMETLFELNLARATTSIFVPDILISQHTDAPGSYLRNADRGTLLPRLREDAPDMAWMAGEVLSEHGAALRHYGPNLYFTMLRWGATQSFLAGNRSDGVRYARQALRGKVGRTMVLVTFALGILGPTFVANGVWAYRLLRQAG